MRMLTKALLAATLAITTLGATSAMAAVGQWNGSTASPVITQTNRNFSTSNIAPGSTPSGAVITSIDYFSSYSGTLGWTFTATVELPLSGVSVTKTGMSGNAAGALVGYGALQPVRLTYRYNSGTTKTTSKTSVATQISVYYSY